MEGCEKSLDRDGNSMTDRISDLPDCLIDCILDRLRFADAVKTCVLSKRWRYCWTRVKRIVFDWGLNIMHSISVDEIMKLNDIINSILLRHDGPIDEFYVIGYIDRDHFYRTAITVEENEYIHRWMQLLLDNGIRRLTFSVDRNCFVSLPSCILNCSTLTHLSLTRCKLGPQEDFMGVGYLGYLCLSRVRISARLLETVITSSAHLEVLILNYLGIDFDGDDDGGVIVINAPVLKELQVMQYNLPIILKETPHLTWANVRFIVEVPMGTRTAKVDYFARMMPRIEKLEITEESLASLASDDTPMKLSFMLHNLKDLQISSYHNFSLTKMACFFCLIRSSPNLESLYISVETMSNKSITSTKQESIDPDVIFRDTSSDLANYTGTTEYVCSEWDYCDNRDACNGFHTFSRGNTPPRYRRYSSDSGSINNYSSLKNESKAQKKNAANDDEKDTGCSGKSKQ